jgi:hypothetical protein
MKLLFVGILVGTSALCWWLSGYDTMVTGEDWAADFRRRAMRCGVTPLLISTCLISPWIFIAATVLIGVIWAGCISELFARGLYTLMERQIKDQPENFKLWLKLAEAHGVYCCSLDLASKTVGRIEANPGFTKEQIHLAKSKLQEWRESGRG